MRLYDRIIKVSIHLQRTKPRMAALLLASIKLCNQCCRLSSQFVGRWLATGKPRRVVETGRHLNAQRPANMTNGFRIQRDVLQHILNDSTVNGILVCTASVYLRIHPLLEWLDDFGDEVDFASPTIRGLEGWSYGGTVAYFSREGARTLVSDMDQNFCDLQDIAIGQWLMRNRDNRWLELPVAYIETRDDFHDQFHHQIIGAVAVICTNSSDRAIEAETMKRLEEWETMPR